MAAAVACLTPAQTPATAAVLGSDGDDSFMNSAQDLPQNGSPGSPNSSPPNKRASFESFKAVVGKRGGRAQSRRLNLGEYGGAIAERAIGGGSLKRSQSTFRRFLKRSDTTGAAPSATALSASSKSMESLLKKRRKTKPWYIIDPRRSQAMSILDTWSTLCHVFTALVTPFEVSFLDMPPTFAAAWTDPLFLLNRIIDSTFVVDLVLQFFLMYRYDDGAYGVKWIDEHKTICRHYLRGWFAFDLISILPSAFDFLPYLLSGPSGDGEVVLKRFKFLRVVRCLRLVKLLRLLRASRLLSRWETRVSINYGYLSLWKVLTAYLLAAHWSGCLLVLQTTFYDNPVQTWLGHYGYCVAESTAGGPPALPGEGYPYDDCYRTINLARGLHTNQPLVDQLLNEGTCKVICDTPGRLFVAAVYFALQMICGATGGEMHREAFNDQEQIAFAFLTALGALLWGQVIGTFVSVIANANPDVTWFRSTMDRLNDFMRVYNLPQEMRMRLREYFQQSKHVQRGMQRKRILVGMSPLLQGEVALAINGRWIHGIRFLHGAEKGLIVTIACSLQPAVFIPGEAATNGYLYIIHKGIALYAAALLTSGRCWGQDMILARQHLCLFQGRAMSYLEVYRLSRAELLHMARAYPVGMRRIRWEALKLAMIRTMIATKRELVDRAEKAAKAGGNGAGAGGGGGGAGEDAWEIFMQQARGPESMHSGRGAAGAGATANGTSGTTPPPKEPPRETTTKPARAMTRQAGVGSARNHEPLADPLAVLETPSLHDLNRSLDKVTSEMAELKQGVAHILDRLGGAAPSSSSQVEGASSKGGGAGFNMLFA